MPGLVISPYAKSGYIDHQQLSHDAYLKFIEDDFLGGSRLDPATDGRPDERAGRARRSARARQPRRTTSTSTRRRGRRRCSLRIPSAGPPSKEPGTAQQPPSVKTGSASSVGPTSVTLSGTVNPNLGIISACKFEYGTVASPGESSVPCATLPEYGESNENVSAHLEGLKVRTSYLYRLVATNNEGGSTTGEERKTKTT